MRVKLKTNVERQCGDMREIYATWVPQGIYKFVRVFDGQRVLIDVGREAGFKQLTVVNIGEVEFLNETDTDEQDFEYATQLA